MTTLTSDLGEETDFNPTHLTQDADPQPDVECLCPFCGSLNPEVGMPCGTCHREDTAATRAANRQKSGQWFVLQTDDPASPELTFKELQALIRQGVVTPRSVVRGPTTTQLWRLASKIRGLSREFGQCFSCGGDIETTEIMCPHCDRRQTVPEIFTPAPPPPVRPRVSTSRPEPRPVQHRASEPTIHVHTLSDHPPQPDYECVVRPIIAEQYGRHIPKDDLLTPRDVAKAFHLEFGIQNDPNDRSLLAARNSWLRFTLSFVAAVVVAIGLGWPLELLFTAMSTPTAAQQSTVSTTPDKSADARPAAEKIIAPRTGTQTASGDPMIIPEGAEVSKADDPTALWDQGVAAESAHDYAGAVANFERIESLPSNLWPPHLQGRLGLARQELKSVTH